MKTILANIIVVLIKTVEAVAIVFKFIKNGLIRIGSLLKFFLKKILIFFIRIFDALLPIFRFLCKPITFLKRVAIRVFTFLGFILAKSFIFLHDNLETLMAKLGVSKTKASSKKRGINPVIARIKKPLSRIILFIHDKPVLIVFILALAVRLIMVGVLNVDTSSAYKKVALNILDGKGWGIWLGPGYSLFLAAVYYISRESFFLVAIIQAILSSFTCVLIYLIARKLINGKAAMIASLLTIFCLPLAVYTELLYPVTLFIFMFYLSILMILEDINNSETFGHALLAGTFIGLTILIKPVMVFFIVPLILIYLSTLGKKAVKKILMIIFICTVILAPYILENYSRHARLTFITTETAQKFYMGNNPNATGRWYAIYGKPSSPSIKAEEGWGGVSIYLNHLPNPEAEIYEENSKSLEKTPDFQSVNYKETHKAFYSEGLKFIIHHPVKWISLVNKKFWTFFWEFPVWSPGYAPNELARFFIGKLFLIVYVFSLFGLIFSFRERKKYLAIYLAYIYLAIIPILTIHSQEYYLILYPIFTVFAALFLVDFTGYVKFLKNRYKSE